MIGDGSERRGEARAVLTRVVPSPIRRGLRELAGFPEALAGWWMVMRGARHLQGTVRVCYGRRAIPGLAQEAHGGIVKFQRMQAVFPNSPGRFNLLYLVSSRMPQGAVRMSRIAQRRHVRVVWNQNGVAYPAWHGPGWERTNAPLAKILHAADHVFYQSTFCKISADRYLGKREGPYEILSNPVETTVFTPAATDPEPNGLVMLLAGTQVHWYRVETALRVLAQVRRTYRNARLLVTGRLRWIPDERRAQHLARQRADQLGVGDRVEFLGPYSQAQAPDMFRKAHLLLHTQYNDSCPSVVVEAMACGLPVVYSNSGGVPELVGEEAGIGVPTEVSWEREIPPDSERMAQAVLEVAARRNRYVQAARERAVARFDLRPWLRRHEDVFAQLCR